MRAALPAIVVVLLVGLLVLGVDAAWRRTRPLAMRLGARVAAVGVGPILLWLALALLLAAAMASRIGA